MRKLTESKLKIMWSQLVEGNDYELIGNTKDSKKLTDARKKAAKEIKAGKDLESINVNTGKIKYKKLKETKKGSGMDSSIAAREGVSTKDVPKAKLEKSKEEKSIKEGQESKSVDMYVNDLSRYIGKTVAFSNGSLKTRNAAHFVSDFSENSLDYSTKISDAVDITDDDMLIINKIEPKLKKVKISKQFLKKLVEFKMKMHQGNKFRTKSFDDSYGAELKESSEYEAFFRNALKRFNVTEPDQLEDDKKKQFFNYVNSNWESKEESVKEGQMNRPETGRIYSSKPMGGYKFTIIADERFDGTEEMVRKTVEEIVSQEGNGLKIWYYDDKPRELSFGDTDDKKQWRSDMTTYREGGSNNNMFGIINNICKKNGLNAPSYTRIKISLVDKYDDEEVQESLKESKKGNKPMLNEAKYNLRIDGEISTDSADDMMRILELAGLSDTSEEIPMDMEMGDDMMGDPMDVPMDMEMGDEEVVSDMNAEIGDEEIAIEPDLLMSSKEYDAVDNMRSIIDSLK